MSRMTEYLQRLQESIGELHREWDDPGVNEFKCGLCDLEYGVDKLDGEWYLPECPECHNTTLQMVRG